MLTRWYNEQKSWRLKRSQIWCGLLQLCGSTMLRWFRAYCRNPPNKSAPWQTSARVKSYQLLKVVSGGRAPGKSSSLASSQLLVIERFHCFRAVRLESVHFWVSRWFLKLIFVHSFKGANAGCCLLAACLLLACCCLPAACLLLLACCLLLLLAAPAAAVAACLCCLPLLLLASAACLCCLPLLLACLLAACLLLLLAAAACLLLLACCCLPAAGGTGGRRQQREGMFLAGWNETLRLYSAVVSLRSPSAPSRTISQDAANGKTAQDSARRNKHNRCMAQPEHRQDLPRFPPAMEWKVLFQLAIAGWIGQQTFWELPTTLMHIAPAIDLAAENKGPAYPYIMLDHSPANRICYS